MKKKKTKNSEQKILDLISEAGLLKRVKRSGWWVVGIKDPETVAEHCFRCAVLGYLIAKMEGADAYRVMLMCLFNDIHEARINDAHKVAVRYLNYTDAENAAFADQIADMPVNIKKEMSGFRRDYLEQGSPESLIARDADILECLIQAKEYYEHGNRQAKLFFRKAPKFLKTRTARKLWKEARDMDNTEWWLRVCDFKR